MYFISKGTKYLSSVEEMQIVSVPVILNICRLHTL